MIFQKIFARILFFNLFYNNLLINGKKLILNDNQNILSDFICNFASDELHKNLDLRKIVVIELENNFSPNFRNKILKCLPHGAAKVVLNFKGNLPLNLIKLPKSTLVIYVAENIRKVKNYLLFIVGAAANNEVALMFD